MEKYSYEWYAINVIFTIMIIIFTIWVALIVPDIIIAVLGN